MLECHLTYDEDNICIDEEFPSNATDAEARAYALRALLRDPDLLEVAIVNRENGLLVVHEVRR